MKISRKNLRQLIEAYIAGEDPSHVYKSAPAYKRAEDKSITALGDALSDKHEAEKLFWNDPKQAQALAGSFAEFSPEEEVAIEMGEERAYDEVYHNKGPESLGPTSMSPVYQEIHYEDNEGNEHTVSFKIDNEMAAAVIISFQDRDVQKHLHFLIFLKEYAISDPRKSFFQEFQNFTFVFYDLKVDEKCFSGVFGKKKSENEQHQKITTKSLVKIVIFIILLGVHHTTLSLWLAGKIKGH